MNGVEPMKVGPVPAPTVAENKELMRIRADRDFLKDHYLYKLAPTIAALPLAGPRGRATVNYYDRFPEFRCMNCWGTRKNDYIKPYITNVCWQPHPTEPGRMIFRMLAVGKFCSHACAFCYGKRRARLFPRQHILMNKLVLMEVYGYKGEVPHTDPHWKLPPFLAPLDLAAEKVRIPFSYSKHQQALQVPIQPPDRRFHFFYSEPAMLVVDVDLDNLHKDTTVAASVWLPRFRADFPQFLYIHDYTSADRLAAENSAEAVQVGPDGKKPKLFDTNAFLASLRAKTAMEKENAKKEREKTKAARKAKRDEEKRLKQQQKQVDQKQKRENRVRKRLLQRVDRKGKATEQSASAPAPPVAPVAPAAPAAAKKTPTRRKVPQFQMVEKASSSSSSSSSDSEEEEKVSATAAAHTPPLLRSRLSKLNAMSGFMGMSLRPAMSVDQFMPRNRPPAALPAPAPPTPGKPPPPAPLLTPLTPASAPVPPTPSTLNQWQSFRNMLRK